MTNNIETHLLDKKKQLATLHSEVMASLRTSLEKAIQIGEILAEVKRTLPHGEFTPFLATLPFSDRTARNYIGVYNNRKMIKTEGLSDLNQVYEFLKAPLEEDPTPLEEEVPTEDTEQREVQSTTAMQISVPEAIHEPTRTNAVMVAEKEEKAEESTELKDRNEIQQNRTIA